MIRPTPSGSSSASCEGDGPRPLPLSVCLITRDEAHNLPGLVASLRGLARELVVVDTGSTDGTPQVAVALGARLIEIDWQDDFAYARNVALDAATSDWVLSMDADQQLDGATAAALSAAVQRQDCMAQLVTVHLLGPPLPDGRPHVVKRLPSIRLVKRDARIRYQGRVHEDVADSLLAMGSEDWPEAGVVLVDHGDVDAQARRGKRERNLRLLRMAHAEDPRSLFAAYKLAITLPQDARDELALVFEKALNEVCRMDAQALGQLPFLPGLLEHALGFWVNQGRLAEAADVALRLWSLVGAPVQVLAGEMLARAGRMAEAFDLLEPVALGRLAKGACRAVLSSADVAVRGSLDTDERLRACRWLAWVARKKGNAPAAAEWVRAGRLLAGPEPHPGLEAVALGLAMDRKDLAGLTEAMAQLTTRSTGAPATGHAITPLLMWASGWMARELGDLSSARAFARLALETPDDVGAMLLAELRLADATTEAGWIEAAYEAIAGCCYDSLALKLQLAKCAGSQWPHPLPEETQRRLRRSPSSVE